MTLASRRCVSFTGHGLFKEEIKHERQMLYEENTEIMCCIMYTGWYVHACCVFRKAEDALPCPIKNHNDCYYLTWSYFKDNNNCVAVSYIIYEEDTILFLTETSAKLDKKTIPVYA